MDLAKQMEILNRARLVDKAWYLERYPEVAALKIDPALHYLKYGARMGRDPRRNFSTRFYLETHPEAAHSGLNPLVYFHLYGKKAGHKGGPARPVDPVSRISTNLFSFGITEAPLRDLHDLMENGATAETRAKAARDLALWNIRSRSGPGYGAALDYVERALAAAPFVELRRQLRIIQMVCHYHLGHSEAAEAAFEQACLAGEASPDLFLARANAMPTADAKLQSVNFALEAHGIPTLALLPDQGASLYDRLCVPQPLPPIDMGPKITVLLAAFEAGDTLPTALRSLTQQTWKNLEVIVLDDCSPGPDTRNVTLSFAGADPRILYHRMETNGGAYVARNRGLDMASGDYITIHDADDWSHPVKLETQARFLMEHPDVLGCTSEQARCSSDLEFTKIRGGGGFTLFNTSSFMWKRSAVRPALGYWDTVRFGADNEFIRRIVKKFGKNSVVRLPTGPLSFQREAVTSITGDSVKGIDIGGYYGVRKEYLIAQQHHHDNPDADLCYDNHPSRRPFPVPEMMLEAKRNAEPRHFDLVIRGDFRVGSAHVAQTLEILRRHSPDTRIALVEMIVYDPSNGSMAWDKDIRDAINGTRVVALVYGDRATFSEEIFMDSDDRKSDHRMLPDLARAVPLAS